MSYACILLIKLSNCLQMLFNLFIINTGNKFFFEHSFQIQLWLPQKILIFTMRVNEMYDFLKNVNVRITLATCQKCVALVRFFFVQQPLCTFGGSVTENISPDCSCNLECQVMTFHLQLERKTLRELLAKRPDISVHNKF